jgi:hypothetical protein
MVTTTVEEVVERAHALTDVEDPAPDHFSRNLRALVDHVNTEADLNEDGLAAMLGPLAVAWRNRIEVDAYVEDHPEVEESEIEAPIIVVGLPRSGTTYSQYLFDQDPRLRMLRTWEGERPVPPPALDPESAQRRLAESIENARLVHELTGGKIDAFHLTDPEGPQECLPILEQTCVNPGHLWTMSVPGYLDYIVHDADLREAYEHHARVLKLLQQGAPERRWALKWSCHLVALQALADQYPDATFIATHRDPVQVLASNCSLAGMLRAGTSAHADPHEVGRDMLDLVRRHVDGLVAFDIAEEKLGADRFVHIDYYRLAEAPETVMPEVFERAHLEWTDEVETRVRTWREQNPKGKRGKHEYRLDDYGLERDAVEDVFRDYINRFDIPREDERT